MNSTHLAIIAAIEEGHLSEALALWKEAHEAEGGTAMLLYLKGRMAMKQGLWDEAITCFSQAEDLDPQSPAKEARQMLDDIMCFYHKDLYNP